MKSECVSFSFCKLASLAFALSALMLAPSASADDSAPAKDSSAANATAVSAALKRSDAATVADLGAASTVAAPTVSMTTGAAVIVPGKAQGLATIGGDTTAQGNSVTKAARTVTPSSELAAAVVGKARRAGRSDASPVPGSEGVIATLGPSFAACAKGPDATATGTAVIGARVAPTGNVEGTMIVASGDMTPASIACFRDVVAHAKFSAIQAPAILKIRVAPQQLAASATPAAQTVASRDGR